LAFVLLLPATESRATEFSSMAGAWTGTGTIAVNNNREKLRCRANYNVSNGGATVDLQIQCASDSTSALSKSPTALSSGGGRRGRCGGAQELPSRQAGARHTTWASRTECEVSHVILPRDRCIAAMLVLPHISI
jgi:hypothetical protein